MSEYLPGNVKPSGSIRFCDQPVGELIFIFFGGLPEDETTGRVEALRLTAVGKHRSLVCPAMNLLRRCIIPSILASLSLMAIPATARAQVTSGEQNAHVGDTPSRADAASLQKKATEAQARIHANKDDRDQLMMSGQD